LATGQANGVEPGMAVQDRNGQALGSVTKVLPGDNTSHGYVVISTPDGKTTPVPAMIASSMTVNGRLVVDRSALKGAPKVQESDLDATTWHKKSDRYWSQHQGQG
jgi:hypothetical protein